jgi:hypothetical protein
MALDVQGTDYLKLPVGTTAQRPATPATGMTRQNSTTGLPEWYDTVSSSWIAFNNPTSSGAPAFAANGSALTSAATDTFTKISYNTKIFDTNTNYSTANSRFTPTVAGYYQFNAFISGPASSSGNNYLFFSFFKNGSRYADSQTTILQLAINVAVIGTTIIYCNGSTDYVEVYGYQGSGVTANIGSQYAFQQFSGAMIRSA